MAGLLPIGGSSPGPKAIGVHSPVGVLAGLPACRFATASTPCEQQRSMNRSAQTIFWIIGLGLFWLVLTRGEISSWVVGLPFIVLALWLMHPMRKADPFAGRYRAVGLLNFAGFFVREALLGSIDVSRRVLAARPDVRPGFYDYPIGLQGSFARPFFVGCISLLPGTLSAEWRGESVRIHTLDVEKITSQDVATLENSIARMSGEVA